MVMRETGNWKGRKTERIWDRNFYKGRTYRKGSMNLPGGGSSSNFRESRSGLFREGSYSQSRMAVTLLTAF